VLIISSSNRLEMMVEFLTQNGKFSIVQEPIQWLY
jgi:hypothetical protein